LGREVETWSPVPHLAHTHRACAQHAGQQSHSHTQAHACTQSHLLFGSHDRNKTQMEPLGKNMGAGLSAPAGKGGCPPENAFTSAQGPSGDAAYKMFAPDPHPEPSVYAAVGSLATAAGAIGVVPLVQWMGVLLSPPHPKWNTCATTASTEEGPGPGRPRNFLVDLSPVAVGG
jgi:hypothetical protein